MLRKWMVFTLSAGLLVTLAGVGFSGDDDESPLEKIMEKVNKANAKIKQGVRNPANYRKKQKEVAENSKVMVKLAKESKPMKNALDRAKNEPKPQEKWNSLMDAFIEKSENLSEVANKPSPDYDATKKAFSTLSKTCTDCHNVFRVEEEKF